MLVSPNQEPVKSDIDQLPLRNGSARLRKVFKTVAIILLVSIALGLISVRMFIAWPDLTRNALFAFLSDVIPSVSAISKYTQNPELSAAVYGMQWFFVPIYIGTFLFAAPWSLTMHEAVQRKAKNLRFKHKLLVIAGVVLLGVYYLAEFHLLSMPTLLNGRLVSPPSANFLQFIYVSNIALAVYGSLAVLCECVMFWVFLVLVCNLKYYLKISRKV